MGTMALRSALARPEDAPWLKAASPALLEMLRDTPALIAPTAFFKGETGAITLGEAFDGMVLYNLTSHAVEILIGDAITVTEPPEGSDQQDTLVYAESRLASFEGQFVYYGKQARQVEALANGGESRTPGWALYLDITVFGIAYDEEFQADTLAELLSLLVHSYPRLWSVLASDPRILVLASLLGFSEHVAPTHFDLPTTAEDMLNAVFDYGASLHSGSGDSVADEGVFDEDEDAEDGEDFSLLMQQAGTAKDTAKDDDFAEDGDPSGLLPYDPDAANTAKAELVTLATKPQVFAHAPLTLSGDERTALEGFRVTCDEPPARPVPPRSEMVVDITLQKSTGSDSAQSDDGV
jgi:hypothetical protein